MGAVPNPVSAAEPNRAGLGARSAPGLLSLPRCLPNAICKSGAFLSSLCNRCAAPGVSGLELGSAPQFIAAISPRRTPSEGDLPGLEPLRAGRAAPCGGGNGRHGAAVSPPCPPRAPGALRRGQTRPVIQNNFGVLRESRGETSSRIPARPAPKGPGGTGCSRNHRITKSWNQGITESWNHRVLWAGRLWKIISCHTLPVPPQGEIGPAWPLQGWGRQSWHGGV